MCRRRLKHEISEGGRSFTTTASLTHDMRQQTCWVTTTACKRLLTAAPSQLVNHVTSLLSFQLVMNISPPQYCFASSAGSYANSWPVADRQRDLLSGVFTALPMSWCVHCLTDVVIYVDQLVQEVFDGGHAAEDYGVKRCHPLLLPVTQLKAQVPDTLQRLVTIKTRYPLTSNPQYLTELSVSDCISQSQRSKGSLRPSMLCGPLSGPHLAQGAEEVPLYTLSDAGL